MSLSSRWMRALAVVPVVAAAAFFGVRMTHQTALAQQAGAPPGCPNVSGKFSGLLAQIPDFTTLHASNNLPKSSIELSSFQFGVGRGISSPTGASSDRESSAPSVSEVTVTKLSDSSDPLLLAEASEGGAHTWTLWIYKSASPTGAPACESITLSNVLVSSFHMSSGGDRPTESLSLNFTKIEYKYVSQNNDSFTLATNSVQDMSEVP